MNLTAPIVHRHPFWTGIDLTRTSDPPIDHIDFLTAWLLYIHLKNPSPISTATYVVEEEI